MENRPVLSLCMIVKNEEKYLQECLESVKGVADEIVIVDTGSNDKTVEIAEKFDAKIYSFKWVNDFSAARNFALTKCSGKWIFYLDADERLSSESKQTVLDLVKSNEKIGAYCKVISLEQQRGSTNIMSYPRLFSYDDTIKFEGAVHEQIEKSLKRANYNFLNTDIEIFHLGYDINHDGLEEKAKRNLELLIGDFAKSPSGYKAFHIGSTLVVLNQLEKAVAYFIEAIKDSSLDSSHKAHCYRYLAAYEINVTHQFDKALSYAKEGITLSEKQPLLNVILSNVYLYKGEFKLSEKYCRLAYKYNNEQKNKASGSFEIIIEESMILQHVINIAAVTANKTLFNDFYPKLKGFSIQEKWDKVFSIFNSLFNNLKLPDELIQTINNFIELDYIEALVVLLSNYEDGVIKSKLLTQLLDKFPNHLGLLFMLGQIKLNNEENEEALRYFETFYSLDKNNPTVVNNLISLYFRVNNIQKLLPIIDDAINLFKSDNEISTKLKVLKDKLLTLYK